MHACGPQLAHGVDRSHCARSIHCELDATLYPWQWRVFVGNGQGGSEATSQWTAVDGGSYKDQHKSRLVTLGTLLAWPKIAAPCHHLEALDTERAAVSWFGLSYIVLANRVLAAFWPSARARDCSEDTVTP
ncbi:hypothetical protein LIA77_07171 [Sarocladium implicatum]|nr:hypothetical protein LIA77_07171 [Sarocladium implicatum]